MEAPALKKLIVSRRQASVRRENDQKKLFTDNDAFHHSVVEKLRGRWDSKQFDNLARCGKESIYRHCKECNETKSFAYQCSLKFCPRCQWKITQRRSEMIGAWAKRLEQPKHLVLTQKNFPVLTRKAFRQNTLARAKIRRLKCWESVKGGCVSVEVTNEGEGWHLHSHWLLDCRWLDMEEISREWGRLVRQQFGIVKIKDLRATDYLAEVSKYVAKGSEIAGWPPELLLEFVRAIRGQRFFFAFGSLFHQARGVRAEIKRQHPSGTACSCGCCDFVWRDEVSELLHEVRQGLHRKTRSPLPVANHPVVFRETNLL